MQACFDKISHPNTSVSSDFLIMMKLFYNLGIFLFSSRSPEDYVDSRSAMPPDLEKPDCAKVFELPYSIHAFQHLRVSRGLTC